MQLPRFTFQNYTQIMQAPYDPTSSHWGDVWAFFLARESSWTNTYAQVDARALWNYLDTHPISGTLMVGTNSVAKKDYCIASKLLCPTTWLSTYFFRDVTQGTHTGLEIIAPLGTPITSFTAGTIVRIKQRDGTSSNEGNCVVVKAPNGYYVCYEHLDTIAVAMGATVSQGTVLGTCGKTGNASQYHLHLQVDRPEAPFHPYRSAQKVDIARWTVDPLACLRARAPQAPFKDLPYDHTTQDAFIALKKASILQWSNGTCLPENTIVRYELALLLKRMITKRSLTTWLPIVQPTYQAYTDLPNDAELLTAVKLLQKYGIMKWSNNLFNPNGTVLGEQLIAVLWRLCYTLQDSPTGDRWNVYLTHFKNLGFITTPWARIGKPAPRKVVASLIRQTLKERGHL
jgi:hypothetical protein